jgi:Fic-DOC domain mobile mystery protein B
VKIVTPPGATEINPDVLQGLIPNLTTQAELNEYEAKNIADAMIWASTSRSLKKDLLSATGLFALHKKMFDQTWKWAGKVRSEQTNIGVAPEKIQNELGVLIGNVKYWIENETYKFDEIGVRFHHKLVWIHPFPNGNGRFSRLAADLLMEFNGHERFNWGSVDLVANEVERQKYFSALRLADTKMEYGPLLKFAKS